MWEGSGGGVQCGAMLRRIFEVEEVCGKPVMIEPSWAGRKPVCSNLVPA